MELAPSSRWVALARARMVQALALVAEAEAVSDQVDGHVMADGDHRLSVATAATRNWEPQGLLCPGRCSPGNVCHRPDYY